VPQQLKLTDKAKLTLKNIYDLIDKKINEVKGDEMIDPFF